MRRRLLMAGGIAGILAFVAFGLGVAWRGGQASAQTPGVQFDQETYTSAGNGQFTVIVNFVNIPANLSAYEVDGPYDHSNFAVVSIDPPGGGYPPVGSPCKNTLPQVSVLPALWYDVAGDIGGWTVSCGIGIASPPISGTFEVVRVTYQCLQEGQFPMHLGTGYATDTNLDDLFNIRDNADTATVNCILNEATDTPTATPTFTQTLTPTITPTFTPTPAYLDTREPTTTSTAAATGTKAPSGASPAASPATSPASGAQAAAAKPVTMPRTGDGSGSAQWPLWLAGAVAVVMLSGAGAYVVRRSVGR